MTAAGWLQLAIYLIVCCCWSSLWACTWPEYSMAAAP